MDNQPRDGGAAFDLIIVGSGAGGLTAALAAASRGLRPLVIEKSRYIGGTSAWSGGALWAPDSPVMRACGVNDSTEDALRYLEAVVGDAGPSTSTARKRAYVERVREVVAFLQGQGLEFVYADGNSDYYPEAPGGSVRGRTHHAAIFDTRRLQEWEPWLRPQKGGISQHIVLRDLAEAPSMVIATRSPRAAKVAARVVGRTLGAKLTGRHRVGMGQAIIAQLMHAARNRGIAVWRNTAVTDLVVENARVTGVVADRGSGSFTVAAGSGVLLTAGGFARNGALRKGYREQASAEWSAVIEEDMGDLITAAMNHGAATSLMDEAIWTPMSIPPNGVAIPHLWERSLPHSIIVDASGSRFCNEATSYMEVGRRMFERDATAKAVPSWIVMDARHRRRYPFGPAPGGITPRSWIRSGYLKKAATLDELARKCDIDPAGLSRTVRRFNGFARTGVDIDFGRGNSHHDRIFSDPRVRPNPTLGALERAPFYAVALYPGDVSTCGGLVTDEHSRVLRETGEPIEALYAAGSTAASFVGRVYPASGCGIGATTVFGFIAARHAADAHDALTRPFPSDRASI
jgi:3-oxosteroid 1-dehydrogenase